MCSVLVFDCCTSQYPSWYQGSTSGSSKTRLSGSVRRPFLFANFCLRRMLSSSRISSLGSSFITIMGYSASLVQAVLRVAGPFSSSVLKYKRLSSDNCAIASKSSTLWTWFPRRSKYSSSSRPSIFSIREIRLYDKSKIRSFFKQSIFSMRWISLWGRISSRSSRHVSRFSIREIDARGIFILRTISGSYSFVTFLINDIVSLVLAIFPMNSSGGVIRVKRKKSCVLKSDSLKRSQIQERLERRSPISS
mmetsp:Transcript_59472/g.81258  ORF Transcript_59472/g.81258 Transcript_59472/m.81258 type:complete len:249 (+) Transcript_59472:441-1187(+)